MCYRNVLFKQVFCSTFVQDSGWGKTGVAPNTLKAVDTLSTVITRTDIFSWNRGYSQTKGLYQTETPWYIISLHLISYEEFQTKGNLLITWIGTRRPKVEWAQILQTLQILMLKMDLSWNGHEVNFIRTHSKHTLFK